ncbi:MAG: PadR family transcriptional regulator [Candidatus Helarchaeota archaeon]
MTEITTREDSDSNIISIADKWQKEMSKGYTKIITLTLLAIKEMHGYQLVELIREKTFRFLNPSPSTIYPILKSLEEKGFIKCKLENVDGRNRKIYSITKQGLDILNEIINRQKKIQESIRSLFYKLKETIFDDIKIDLNDEIFLYDLEQIQKNLSNEELLKKLEVRKGIIASQINKMKKKLTELNESIKKIKNKIHTK